MTTDAVYFGLLGPLDIRHAGRKIPLAAGRQRTVLALLLLQANHEVTVESLIKQLWDGEPPQGARNTVQAYVARLRRTLRAATGSDPDILIRTGPCGYALTIPDDTLDLTRFRTLASAGERSVSRGELHCAVRDFTEALGLWRGAALQDVPCESIQRDDAPALEDERLRVTERLCDLELMLGEPASALARLRSLTAERPLRERPWCQLVTALYRCGRRAEALTAYHDIARILYTELGVEPGPDLREVHACVLADVDIAWPPQRERRPARVAAGPRTEWSEPRQLPPSPAGFTGRETTLDRVARLLGTPSPAAGCVPVVVLTGAPGAGKTALAVRAAHRLTPRFPDGQLFVSLTGPCGTPREPGELLADALHATGAGADAIPPGTPARSAMLRARLAGRRVLLVLDDATDAAQVTPLLPGEPGCAVAVTARAELPDLTAFHGAHRLTLGPLDPQDSVTLLARIAGSARIAAEPTAAAELAELCGHLPLALCAAAADLAARAFTSVGGYAAELRIGDRLSLLSPGPGGGSAVRTAFDRAYLGVPPAARRLFRLLGAAPLAEPDPGAAAVLAGLPRRQAEFHLRQLAAAHLIIEHAPGRLRLPGLLRPYAAELAHAEEDPAQLRAARVRLLCWYAARTATAVRTCVPAPADRRRPQPFTGPRQARAWLESEAGNLAALARAAAAAWPEEG